MCVRVGSNLMLAKAKGPSPPSTMARNTLNRDTYASILTRTAMSASAPNRAGSVLIWPRAFGYKLWIAILVVSLFTIPKLPRRVGHQKAELYPMGNRVRIDVIDAPDKKRVNHRPR